MKKTFNRNSVTLGDFSDETEVLLGNKSSKKQSKIKNSISKILFDDNGNFSFDESKISELIFDSYYYLEFIDLQNAINKKNPELLIDAFLSLEKLFNSDSSDPDLILYKYLVNDFFINQNGLILYSNSKLLQKNSTATFFYLSNCNIEDAILLHSKNKLPLQTLVILYERILILDNFSEYLDILSNLRDDIDLRIKQIDFLYLDSNKTIAERMKKLTGNYTDRVKNIIEYRNNNPINKKYLLGDKIRKKKIVRFKNSSDITENNLKFLLGETPRYSFLTKALNSLRIDDFEVFRTVYNSQLKIHFSNIYRYDYNFLFFYYFSYYIEKQINKGNLDSSLKDFLIYECKYWCDIYKEKMMLQFGEEKLEMIIKSTQSYFQTYFKFIQV